MAKHNVLSTKKLEPSLLEMAKSRGIELTEQEAIRVNPILRKEKWHEISSLLEQEIEYAVFTSSNAVTAARKYISDYVNHLPIHWKIFCLSGKTKETLENDAELFGRIEATASSAAELAQQMIEYGVKELLFFCGDRRREELPTILQSAGVKVHEVVVYEVEETPVAANGDYEAVLFFSPSAVQSFFAVNQLTKGAVCFAIGNTTAESLRRFTDSEIVVSEMPLQEAVLAAVLTYFEKAADTSDDGEVC